MISAPSVEHPKLIMNRGAKLSIMAELCKSKTLLQLSFAVFNHHEKKRFEEKNRVSVAECRQKTLPLQPQSSKDKARMSRPTAAMQPAPVAELADAPDLGSGVPRREGSSPSVDTKKASDGEICHFFCA